MLNGFWISVLVGTLLGFLSGLGVGGGSLLILWLTLVLGMEPAAAREINLLFFLPAAAVSCLFRWKQGVLQGKKVLPGILAGCAAAFLGTRLSKVVDTELLKKAFGILLLVTGLREIFYQPKPSRRAGS